MERWLHNERGDLAGFVSWGFVYSLAEGFLGRPESEEVWDARLVAEIRCRARLVYPAGAGERAASIRREPRAARGQGRRVHCGQAGACCGPRARVWPVGRRPA